MKQERIDKISYYLDIIGIIAQRNTCRRRVYGVVIIQHDEIVFTGYVSAPRGRVSCLDLEYCIQEKLRVPWGERYKLCCSVHAEINTTISAQRSEMLGADMFLIGYEAVSGGLAQNSNSRPVYKRTIINVGVSRVYTRDTPSQCCMIDVYDGQVLQDESLDGVLGY